MPQKTLIKTFIISFFINIVCVPLSSANQSAIELPNCYDSTHGLPSSKTEWQQLKSNDFIIEDTVTLAMLNQVKGCFAESDPEIRDGIGYEALSTWLRGNNVNNDVLSKFMDGMLNDVNKNIDNEAQVYRAFLFLGLSEVVRVDRISPYLTDEQRQNLTKSVSGAFSNINDYRGFNHKIGWRHQVAHLSDVVLQIALNKQFTEQQLTQIYSALFNQVTQSAHAYVFNEGERLSRAVLYGLVNPKIPLTFWQSWFDRLADPTPFKTWRDIYQEQPFLIKRHNIRQFLAPLGITTLSKKSEKLAPYNEIVSQAWNKLN
jgi:hypothetical protein